MAALIACLRVRAHIRAVRSTVASLKDLDRATFARGDADSAVLALAKDMVKHFLLRRSSRNALSCCGWQGMFQEGTNFNNFWKERI